MSKIDHDTKAILKQLMGMLVPEGMTAQERRELAAKAGISPETLRTGTRRTALNADTLIRLLLARGVSPEPLKNLPQTELKQLPKGESDWILLGRELSEAERQEFVGLVRFMKVRWSPSKS